ncbi:MAG: glycosyltransferase family 4 protein [Candidatus Egerieousia sp.]
MKILYFHQHFTTPKAGGAIRSYEFARRLIQKGHHVIMVTGGTTDTFNLQATKKKNVYRGFIDGIDVIQIAIPYSNNDGIAKRFFSFVKFAFKSIYYAMHEDYDLAFATSTPLTAGIPCIWAKWFRGKDYVFEVRDLWPELPKAMGMKNPFLIWGMSVLEWLSYHNAKACIGLAPGIKEGIARRSQKGKPLAMIPNGCDLDLFTPGKREDLNIAGVKPTDTVAVFTGAHGLANGLDAVLNAANVLMARGRNDIKFVFIGKGKLKPALKERAQKENLENCIFLDYMSKADLSKIMCSADIGLQTLANISAFYYGTSPNKFFDYITAGRPVLNNYPGWLADIINKNHCGIVVPPDNAEAFADGMIYVADHPEKRKEFGENARALAEREFDRNILGVRFVDFIEEVYKMK